MKKTALSFLALALTAGSALAADLPSKKAPTLPPPPAPAPLWTGFYVGLNAGGAWADNPTVAFRCFDSGAAGFGANQLLGAFPASLSPSQSSFVGGGQVGYNWQVYDHVVVTVEADIQGFAGGGGTTNTTGFGGVGGVTSASRGLDYLGTVRGRAGWLFTPTLLLYGTGGLSYGGVSLNASFAAPGLNPPLAIASSFADTRVGWTAGGGGEWLFWPSWSAKVEYLYYDLGAVTASSALYVYGADLSGVTTTSRFNGNIVRGGLNYHFNWGGLSPLASKY
jgi:outer membrane immunogenic protein